MKLVALLLLFPAGLTIVSYYAGWQVAVGVFLLLWAHNAEHHLP